MKQITLTFTILSLILISTIYVQACTNYTDCASKCEIGLPACLNGKCVCLSPTVKVAATPLTKVLTPEKCISDCDCKIQCQFGHKICRKNICGCIDHPKYTPPICTN